MSSTVRNQTTKMTKLWFYFWLPAGRDEFELASRDNSSLLNAAKYRGDTDNIEGTIAERLMSKLTGGSSAGLRLSGNPRMHDADLGLRKVEFEFRYEREQKEINFSNELTGSGFILANGLYFWQFDFEYASDSSDQEVTEAASKFLREDFVVRHIATLFKFEWAEHESNALSSYDGVLTYYQIDLLFNSFFDKDAHPHNFMNPRSAGEGAVYDVGGIIRSVSLFAIKNHHLPLFGGHTDTSLEASCRNVSELPISTDIELFETGRDIKKAEQSLSCISYAGMEQFLKVATSFGLIHYKAGLDHCRAQLTNEALLIRINKTSGELRRPSLPLVLSSADLQSYASIVAGKLPAFLFLHRLVEGLAQTSRPFEAQKANTSDGHGWAEWVYSCSTLHNALLHYKLHVEAIRADVTEIDRSLALGRIDQVIAELTDTRKIAEIESESPKKINDERRTSDLDALMVIFTLFALIFSFVQAYASIGVWVMDRLLNGKEGPGLVPGGVRWWEMLIGFGQWMVLFLVLVFIYNKLRTRRGLFKTPVATTVATGQRPRRSKRKGAIYKSRSVRDTGNNNSKQPERVAVSADSDAHKGEILDSGGSKDETHVFDYSFLHAKLKDRSAETIKKLAGSMPSILPGGKWLNCAGQSSFRETPLSAVERTKYTLESHTSPQGSYIFYIEVDRRMNIDDEYLREVRLVIRKPVGEQYSVKECAKHIVLDCVKSFDFADVQKREILELLGDQFK